MLLFGCSWFYFGFIKRDLFRVGKFCFHFSRKLGSIVEYVNAIASVRKACKMKFLAIAPLRIYFCGTGAAGRGPGSFNAVASWVIACEYLSLRLHVGNHSRPTPFKFIFVVALIFSPPRMGCRAWAWFLPRFPVISVSLRGLKAGFFLPLPV